MIPAGGEDRPLTGFRVLVAGTGPVARAGVQVLSALGACPQDAPGGPGRVALALEHPAGLPTARPPFSPPPGPHPPVAWATYRPSPFEDEPAPGLPAGVDTLARGLALAVGAAAAALARLPVSVDGLGADLAVWLPEVVAASYGAPPPRPPRPAVPAPGGGWVACDLATADDLAAYQRLLATLPAGADGEEIAATAQLWRLPVCPYRPRPRPAPVVDGPRRTPGPTPSEPLQRSGAATATRPSSGRWPPLRTTTIVDLTAMWAGPLCTWLLGRLGATVVKVEPDCRLDGLRALDGGGIHPGGRSRRDGTDSGLFNALNSGKQRLAADLRHPAERAAFDALVAQADVVVDSFSPRVRPNLGLTRDTLSAGHRDLVTVSVPAFGPGPERHWIAYGTGVHAAIGLGDDSTGRYVAPAVSYPDPIGGLGATATVLAGLLGRTAGWAPVHLEAPLAETAALALDLGEGSGTLGRPAGDLGRRLLTAATDAGLLAEVTDGAGRHRYPVGFLVGPRPAPPLTAAPGLRPQTVGAP